MKERKRERKNERKRNTKEDFEEEIWERKERKTNIQEISRILKDD